MKSLNHFPVLLALLCALCITSVASAHLDIAVLRTVDGQLVTGHGDHEGGELHVGERVFEGGFEPDLTSHSPGFTAPESADELPEGYVLLPPETTVRFDPFAFTLPDGTRTNLAYWDGNGEVEFAPVPGGVALEIEQHDVGLSVTIDGSSAGVDGFDFAQTDDDGGIHSHLLYTLGAGGVPTEGIYLWSLELSMPGMTTAEPLFLLHETAAAPLTLDVAVAWVEQNLGLLVPANLPGDANGDGFVTSADLDLVRANWGQIGDFGAIQGDLNADGAVNSGDLDLVRANWGRSFGDNPVGVPEPSSVILLLFGIAAFAVRPRGVGA